MRKPDPRFISVCAFSVAQAADGSGDREQVGMLAGLQVGRLRASTPGGVGSVANTGLGKVRFWKCGNSWAYGRIFGCVAIKEVRGGREKS